MRLMEVAKCSGSNGLGAPVGRHGSASVRACTQWNPRRRSSAAARRIAFRASSGVEKPPSMMPNATELELLGRWSTVVPDTMMLESPSEMKAAVVNANLVRGIIQNPSGLASYELAIEQALSYGKEVDPDRKSEICYDKALTNVGAILAEHVEGRVSTEIDPRLANDAGALVARARQVVGLYKDMGVSMDKILIRIPATWQGLEAAKVLEAEGVATHVVLVYSFVQAVAAAQAGVSVIQPDVGRLKDWYRKHPNVIRDPKGPREDSGFQSTADPGVKLVERIYNYTRKYHGTRTKVLVGGVRTAQQAMALAGVDYIVVSAKVMDALRAAPTAAGYNDGLHSGAGPAAEEEEGANLALTPKQAQAAEFDAADLQPVDEERFIEELGMSGMELLDVGLASQVQELQITLEQFTSMAVPHSGKMR